MVIDESGNVYTDEEIFGELNNKKVILYGASNQIEERLSLELKYANVLFICDRDSLKNGREFAGFTIRHIDLIEHNFFQDVIFYSVVRDYLSVVNTFKQYNIKRYYIRMCEDIDNYLKYFVETNHFFYINKKICQSDKRYKYVNFILDEKFIVPVYTMLEKNMDISEHIFIIHGINVANINDRYNLWDVYEIMAKKNENIYVLDNACNLRGHDVIEQMDELEDIINGCSRIVFHSGYISRSLDAYFLKHKEWLEKKSTLIMWGAERFVKKDSLFYCRFLENIGVVYNSISDMSNLVYNFSGEIVKSKLDYLCTEILTIKPKKKSDTKIRIMVGHSGEAVTNHVRALSKLIKYKEENIMIYCPLSYANDERDRINRIISYGNDNFGDKFIPITAFMSLDKYYDLISQMDIYLSSAKVRAGNTTLKYMLSCGIKVYADRFDEMWKELAQIGVKCEDLDAIDNESFDDFCRNPYGTNNSNILLQRGKCAIDEWEKIYQ